MNLRAILRRLREEDKGIVQPTGVTENKETKDSMTRKVNAESASTQLVKDLNLTFPV
jgi:hypothetical protein